VPAVSIDDTSVYIHLNLVEKLSTLSRDLTIPRSDISWADVTSWTRVEVKGFLIPRTVLPGIVMGRVFRPGGRDLVVVDKRGPVVVMQLQGQPFDRVYVSVRKADELLGQLGLPRGPGP
jgi:hypothetical protein